MNIILKKDMKSFITVIIFGILMGSLCATLDLIPGENIWTFSSFSGSVGFWAITGMIVLMQSDNIKLAGINTFLYFTFMNTSFFFTYLLLPITSPRVTTFAQAASESLNWMIASLICGVCALIAYQAKKNNLKGIIALSLSLGVLSSEFVSLISSVFINHKFLFQTIVDFIGIILLYRLYKDKKDNKFLVLAIIVVAALLLIYQLIVNHNILYY